MAETEILKAGAWQERRLQAGGAVLLEVMTSTRGATLAVDGLHGSLRHHSPTAGAFPLKAATTGVTVVAVAPEGMAFPGGAVADLSVAFPSTSQSFLLQGIDISGHTRAPLAALVWDQDRWQLRPAAEPERAARPAEVTRDDILATSPAPRPATVANPGTGVQRPLGAAPGVRGMSTALPAEVGSRESILGSWLARRLAERGELHTPHISALHIDDSASMHGHRERASELAGLVRAFVEAAGAPAPEIRTLSIGGAEHAGVGSAAVSPLSASVTAGNDEGVAFTITITDLPGRAGSAPSLIIGDPAVVSALVDSGSSFVVPAEAWREIEREDTDYDDATLRHLAPLTKWLEDPHRMKENAR